MVPGKVALFAGWEPGYGPAHSGRAGAGPGRQTGAFHGDWWARLDSNQEPDRYERSALTIELRALKGSLPATRVAGHRRARPRPGGPQAARRRPLTCAAGASRC